jgi:hypothetical protein
MIQQLMDVHICHLVMHHCLLNTHNYTATSGGCHTLPRRGRKERSSKRMSYYDGGQDILYVSRCICLLTRLPVVAACESIVRTLYRLICSSEPPPLPMESYIFWLLNEV